MGVIGLLSVLDPSAPIAPPSLVPLGTAGFAIPLGFNIIVTSLIVGRIWWYGRRVGRILYEKQVSGVNGMSHLRSVMSMIIESGALYLAVQMVFLTLFAMNHPAQGVIVPIAVQIYVRTSRQISSVSRVDLTEFTGHRSNSHFCAGRPWPLYSQ